MSIYNPDLERLQAHSHAANTKLSAIIEKYGDKSEEREIPTDGPDRFTDWVEMDTEQTSRAENRLLWEMYDDIAPKAEKAGVPVDWVSDDLETVVIGNYEVSQGTFGKHNYKCLDILPHGADDLSKFRLFFNEAEDAMSFFEAHIYALESVVK